MEYVDRYLSVVEKIANGVDRGQINRMVDIISDLKNSKGRLFILGVGGSAANCSHAVNDFRKLANIETYTPVDNVSELTARTNDEGWDTVFSAWMLVSKICSDDVVMVFSVGGGNADMGISANIVSGLKLAKSRGARVVGIVSRDGGYTAKVADACVLIPVFEESLTTQQAEAWQGVIWHLIVGHPKISQKKNKWESVSVVSRKGDTIEPNLGA